MILYLGFETTLNNIKQTIIRQRRTNSKKMEEIHDDINERRMNNDGSSMTVSLKGGDSRNHRRYQRRSEYDVPRHHRSQKYDTAPFHRMSKSLDGDRSIHNYDNNAITALNTTRTMMRGHENSLYKNPQYNGRSSVLDDYSIHSNTPTMVSLSQSLNGISHRNCSDIRRRDDPRTLLPNRNNIQHMRSHSCDGDIKNNSYRKYNYSQEDHFTTARRSHDDANVPLMMKEREMMYRNHQELSFNTVDTNNKNNNGNNFFDGRDSSCRMDEYTTASSSNHEQGALNRMSQSFNTRRIPTNRYSSNLTSYIADKKRNEDGMMQISVDNASHGERNHYRNKLIPSSSYVDNNFDKIRRIDCSSTYQDQEQQYEHRDLQQRVLSRTQYVSNHRNYDKYNLKERNDCGLSIVDKGKNPKNKNNQIQRRNDNINIRMHSLITLSNLTTLTASLTPYDVLFIL